jgi:hypothetical protein
MSFESSPSAERECRNNEFPESMFEQIISAIKNSPVDQKDKDNAIQKFKELQNNTEFVTSFRARINTLEELLHAKPDDIKQRAYDNLALETARELLQK